MCIHTRTHARVYVYIINANTVEYSIFAVLAVYTCDNYGGILRHNYVVAFADITKRRSSRVEKIKIVINSKIGKLIIIILHIMMI